MNVTNNRTMPRLRCSRSLCRKTQVEMSERGHNQEMKQTEEHDLVCGMKVDSSEAAASIEHHGATVYFCSESCAAKFGPAPAKYVQAKPGADPSHPAPKTDRKSTRLNSSHLGISYAVF